MIDKLKELEKISRERGIPIVGPNKGKWLYEKIVELQPKKILELGTANGYSGIILASEGAELTTIEINPGRAAEARSNYIKYNIDAKIIVGDAVEEVKKMSQDKQEMFDLIFIDFVKKDYINVLYPCMKLVKTGGHIIADNISFSGCQNYKKLVMEHEKLKTKIIDIEDGLSISQKK